MAAQAKAHRFPSDEIMSDRGKSLFHKGRRSVIRVARRMVPGAPPGTERAIVHEEVGNEASASAFAIPTRVFSYDVDSFEEEVPTDIDRLAMLVARRQRCWVDIEGVGSPDWLEQVGKAFGWHPLVVEDVASLHQRPKAEDYEGYAYVVLRMPSGPDGLPFEQVNLLFGDSYVVTIQAGRPGDCLEPVRERLRKARGRVRGKGADYLAYCIIDAVVDHYFPIVEGLNARLDALEGSLGHAEDAFSDMHAIRNDLHAIWRTVSATREAVGRLIRGETMPVSTETRTYLRDCHDHCAQLLDAIGACRELSASLMDLHESMVNNRMGEGMRVLTMIATIFMPMSFIAGVYGMNFDPQASRMNMPELSWEYGYPFALGLMVSVGIGFAALFRRRGWIRRPGRRDRN